MSLISEALHPLKPTMSCELEYLIRATYNSLDYIIALTDGREIKISDHELMLWNDECDLSELYWFQKGFFATSQHREFRVNRLRTFLMGKLAEKI